MINAIVYGRIVEKRELKCLREEQTLLAQEQDEYIPVFYVPFNEDFLFAFFSELQEKRKFRDEVRSIHKALGGSGAGQFVVLFVALDEPEVKGIRLRKQPLPSILEAKFKSGTRILIQAIF